MKEQILLGTLLGDGSISKLSGREKSHRISWEHSQKQKDYAIWKADNSLDNYSIYERSRLDNRTGNIYHSITLYSTKDNYKEYRELFYPKGIKKISKELLMKLTPLGIAIWFMDDGNLYYNGNNCHLTLSINGFDEESRVNIINFFKEQYNILFKRTGKAIRITSVKQTLLWESFFKEYYHKSMLYKTLDFQKTKYKNNKYG